MKSQTVRLNEEQLQMLISMIDSNIRICDPELIKRGPDEQARVDIYKLQLEKLRVKLLTALSSVK